MLYNELIITRKISTFNIIMNNQKTLIITGGSKGIGKSIIQKFLCENYRVINISRSPCSLDNVLNISADLAEDYVEEKIAKTIVPLLSPKELICLVHCAAHYEWLDIVGQQKRASLQKSLTIGILFPSLLNNIIIPHMDAGSSIIYMGSTLSEKAVKNTASYSTCKHAIAGLMKATCQDLSDLPIITSCICPGFTETEMLVQHLGSKAENLEFAKNMVGAKRLIQPEEIADVVYFASKTPVLNGAMIHANLGQLET